ncbi:MAG: diguanylate cyclase, partial [Thermoguttaceae bacterium]
MAARKRNFNDVRLRILDSNGKYHWCNFSGISLADIKGRPKRSIVFVENIDEQVQKEQILANKAEKDQLTGLYNKSTTETLIKATLTDRKNVSGVHGLMIIDADNFKQVNDRLGHQWGDDVLVDVSQKLKPIFRADDIVGRVGGDEFFVFMKNYGDTKLLQSKAEEICEAFRNTYNEGDVSVSISASVGIATYPEHGTDFESLYKNADTALYITKEKGKNCYTLFDGVSSAHYKSDRAE